MSVEEKAGELTSPTPEADGLLRGASREGEGGSRRFPARPACTRGTHSTSTLSSPRPPSYLPNSIGEDVDDLLMWCGYDTLAVDLNDPMSHADPTSLGYSPSHEAADLPEANTRLHLVGSATSRGGGRRSSLEPWCTS